MCMVVYIASDYPLPTWAWEQSAPGFHVAELTERDEPVRRQFTKPCVYYVGSHEGCGCGFQIDPDFDQGADLAAKRESRRRLVEYLRVALQHQPEIELFACWNGDEAAEPEHLGRLRPADLITQRSSFDEKELLVMTETVG